MRTNFVVACFTFACVAGIVSVRGIDGQDAQGRALKEAESRLRRIYDQGEFRAKRFRADWLPDSSGYTVMETSPGADDQVLVRYGAASGKRTALESRRRQRTGRSSNRSLDGQRVLYSDEGNLHVCDLDGEPHSQTVLDVWGNVHADSLAPRSPARQRCEAFFLASAGFRL
jgi:dipeptidyl-peptidase-4